MILSARASQAALFLALGVPSSIGASDPLLRGNQPHHRSLRLAGGKDEGRGKSTKLGCTVLEKVPLCEAAVEDSAERCLGDTKREFVCEDLQTGALYEIVNDLEELAGGGRNTKFAFDDEARTNLLTSAAVVFVGRADVDPAAARISLVSGTFGKSEISRGTAGAPAKAAAGAPAKAAAGAPAKAAAGAPPRAVGNRNVVVLNVVSNDGTTTAFDNDELADSIFGSLAGEPDQVDLASQYSACSHGQLNFFPQPDSVSGDPAVSDLRDGVATVYSTLPTSAGGMAMSNDATSLLKSAHGARGGADHVMVCLPEGTIGGAWAIPNHWKSVYNHKWCARAATQMHEVGHNLGLSHAGEGDKQYGDGSGYMGNSGGNDRKCFSGPKTYYLGWFADRHVELRAGAGFSGRLYGFTRYAATDPGDKMIIRINDPACSTCDWYISFNHRADFNQDTGEGKNEVQLHTKERPVNEYKNTYVEARLDAQSSYTAVVNGKSMEVNVGEINTAEGWAQVSVVPQEGMCEYYRTRDLIAGDEICFSASDKCEAQANLGRNDKESCDDWCARSGLTCAGAWDDGDFCERLDAIPCGETGNKRSICQCEAGLCQGFLAPDDLIVGQEICSDTPDECVALADLGQNDKESCDEWCGRQGLTCTGAWDDGDFCEKLDAIPCGETGNKRSICQCENVVGLCQSFLAPVDLIASDMFEGPEICSDTPDECVANADLALNGNESCDEWCERRGLTCAGAWDNGDFCEKLGGIPCGLAGNKKSICRCEAGGED